MGLRSIRTAPVLAVVVALVLAAAPAARAQTPLPAAGNAAQGALALPDPLTREAIHDVLSQLDDRQVRAVLLERLSGEARRRAEDLARRDRRGLGDIAGDHAAAVGAFLTTAVTGIPQVPNTVARAFDDFAAKRGGRGAGAFLAALVLGLGGGLLAAMAARHLTRSWRDRRPEEAPGTLWPLVRRQALAFMSQAVCVVAFVFVGHAVGWWVSEAAPADRDTIALIITELGRTWLVVAVARFVLSPERSDARLCAADDATARRLVIDCGLIAAVFNLGFGFTVWMDRFGVAFGESWLGLWVNLVFHLLVAGAIWRNRSGLGSILLGRSRRPDGIDRWFASRWPLVAIALLALHWCVTILIAATTIVDRGILTTMALTLAILIGAPMLDRSVRAAARGLVPSRPDRDPALQAADEATRLGVVRVCRVAAGAAGAVFLLELWGVDIEVLAEQGVGARFAGAIIDTFLIVVLAYGLWELIRIVTDRQIAVERVALGVGGRDEEVQDGEGGGAGARLGTLLPLVKLAARIAIVVMAALAVLGELGVNILPLLAGASVLGLAIGFGAQTLVKDIVSGIFFLIDDAFRGGEYVDIGGVKGTVEKISIRSMQLRHHRGPLHTVPFGDIRHVTNFSRDWAIMKLPLRLTYDTDAEKVRKMIKKLGQELMADPELGPQFLQPLKSQGVVQMQDSAQIMSVKFMTRPGGQWMLRRVVFARIRELFEEQGIRFANREVTVRLGEEGADGRPDGPGRGAAAVAGAAARIVTEPDADAGAGGTGPARG